MGDCQAVDAHDYFACINVKDPAGVATTDVQLIRAESFDIQVSVDDQLAAGQCDGLTPEMMIEIDRVPTLCLGNGCSQ